MTHPRLLAAGFLVVMTASAPVAQAQCAGANCMTSCTTAGSDVTCIANFQKCGGTSGTATVLSSSNATCNPAYLPDAGSFRVSAMGMTGDPGFCQFQFNYDFGGAQTFQCRIDGSDGLPVELLDFSVDEESGPTGE